MKVFQNDKLLKTNISQRPDYVVDIVYIEFDLCC